MRTGERRSREVTPGLSTVRQEKKAPVFELTGWVSGRQEHLMSKVDIFVGVSIETQEQSRVVSVGALPPQEGRQCLRRTAAKSC